MKRQHGFTLIELLLVIAIIGIIVAIAVPTYLDQRSKGRDAAAKANCVNLISEFVSVCDRARDDGIDINETTFKSDLIGTAEKSMLPSLWREKNPWHTKDALEAYNVKVIHAETDVMGTVTRAAATEDNKGQVQIGYMPSSESNAATIFLAVYLNKKINKEDADNVLIKSIGVD
jgi:prepilin-type N-terminal cleavage/methylation domain-containing protein